MAKHSGTIQNGDHAREMQKKMIAKRPARYTPQQIDRALMTMIAVGGSSVAASRALAEEDWEIGAPYLCTLRRRHAIRYDELREQLAAQSEASLAHEFRDQAMQATQAVRLAVEKSTERLESGEDHDPARSAANLSKVAHVSVDKLMTLTQRPSEIRETRTADELLRSLMASGVLRIPDAEVVEAKQLESGDPDDGEP